MRHITMTLAAAALLAGMGCDREIQAPVGSAPAFNPLAARAIGGACDAARAKLIGTQQADLWAKPQLTVAQSMFAAVSAACGTATDKSLMLAYIQWTIDNRGSIITQASGGKLGNLVVHWNTVFPYVDYTGADQPSNVDTAIFSPNGAAKVVPAGIQDSLNAANAAMTVYPQLPTGDQRDHLFVLYPINSNCLSGSNLHQFGPCFEFAAFPHVAPKFDPKAKVGVCQPLNHDQNLPYTFPALGHLTGTFVEIPGQTHYPLFCPHLDGIADAGSWSGGISGITKRLAWLANKNFGVETAYAVHGGLGGLGGGLSPFGAVNLEVFHATFENEVVGTRPTTPEAGTWGPITVTAPGSIAVDSSLGASATGQLVVLNQAGGACKNCGGLLLQGNLFVESGQPAAHDGVYEATFVAFQDNANMKAASFKLRDASNKVLADVTFTVQSNTNKILFNGSDTGVRWVRHIPLSFKVDVDLVAHTASLWIDSVQRATSVAFVDNTLNFTNIAADFKGIDSGVMGWDEIRVVRLQDSQ
jgi:hypothetical protein